jgi:hypothetical protein
VGGVKGWTPLKKISNFLGGQKVRKIFKKCHFLELIWPKYKDFLDDIFSVKSKNKN